MKTVSIIVLVVLATSNYGQVMTLDKPVRGMLEKDVAVWSDYTLLTKIARTSAVRNDTVDVIAFGNWTFKVSCKAYTGFVAYASLLNTGPEIGELQATMSIHQPELARLEEEAARQAEIKQLEEALAKAKKRKAQLRAELEKKYGKKVTDRIEAGEYWIGMDRQMALLSLGDPDDINRTVTATTRKEQWVYRDKGVNLYFTNGICDAFQD